MVKGTLKVRAKRKKETKPREQGEAEFRKDVYKFLKYDKRIKYYKRIENSITRKAGNDIPDFLFFTFYNMYWLEIKFGKNDLSKGQVVFKAHCTRTRIKHITAWTIANIEKGIRRVEG